MGKVSQAANEALEKRRTKEVNTGECRDDCHENCHPESPLVEDTPLTCVGYKFEFEKIDDYNQCVRVPGGWIVKAVEEFIHDLSEYGSGLESGWDFRVALCFVPDPKHEWVITERKRCEAKINPLN